MKMVEKEIEDGFVLEFQGSEEDARRKWKDVSIGKLNIVRAPGKDDRLTLDSSITLLNHQLGIQEKTFPPGPRDVEATAPEAEDDTDHLSFTADVKSAHKSLRLRPDQQGQCMFRLMQRLFFYVVCHFGGGFSDYGRKRFSAFLIRWWHRLISRRGFIYTVDLLFIFKRACAALFAALLVVSGDVLGVRWSYHKFEFGEQVKWIGLLWIFS